MCCVLLALLVAVHLTLGASANQVLTMVLFG
jgi:hypothetical protein